MGLRPASLAALALLLAPAPPAAGAGFLPYRDDAAVARGKALYAEHCAACHGARLQGQPDWQRRGDDGLMPAPPHDATGHTWHHSDAQLFDLTKHGVSAVLARRGLDYDSAMTGFGDVLDDDQINEVLAFIKSTWPDRVIEMHDEINASR